MSNDTDTVIANDNYIKSTWCRFKNAFTELSFWRELIAYFILGSLGLWLPCFLNMPGANTVFEPMNVLTFGLVTLFIILEARVFMAENDDGRSPGTTKVIVLVGFVFLCIGYVKGVLTNGMAIAWGISWVHLSLFFTILIWIVNHVNTSRYDSKNINSMLGGNV
ncbi:hypothetical protein [Enterobacter ludwigii]|uniref:hypothetical protein n=1 Tax=Enterobacter ludwigii TaxID=299767 RepID=UPI003B627565